MFFYLIQNLTTVPCSEISRNENLLFYQQFGRYNLSEFYCISPGQNITLTGKYADRSMAYSSLRISFKKCEPEFCQEGFPDYYFGSQFVIFYTTREVIHSNDPDQIIKWKSKNVLINLSNQMYKRKSIYFSKGIY